MTRLSLLRAFTTILFTFGLIILFFLFPFIFAMAVFPERIPAKLIEDIAPVTTIDIILLFTASVGSALLVYALYLFRRVLYLFKHKQIFHNDVIKNFDYMGKVIISGYLLMAISSPEDFFYINDKFNILMVFIFSSAFLGAGLFFLVLAKVFKMAKDIKEENDLTV
jgi:hypothetical protein